MEERGEVVTWDVFEKQFFVEYFPNSVRYAKKEEIFELVQGSMFVVEYMERFRHIGCFHFLPLNEEWQCQKFENGFRGDIKMMVMPFV